jgi:hypothetical protein
LFLEFCVGILKDVSIKQKLTLIAVLPSTLVLLTAVLIFFIFDEVAQKKSMVQEATMLTQVIGANNSAALLFNDTKSATENLAVLSANAHVISGGIYTADDDIFAGYFRKNNYPPTSHPLPKKEGYFFEDGTLSIFRTIIANDTKIGTVYLKLDLDALYSRRKGYIAIAASILGLVSALVFFLSAWLKKAISDPVMSLAETARKITLEITLRVPADMNMENSEY